MIRDMIRIFKKNLKIDRSIKFFTLPSYYFKITKIKECNKPRFYIMLDLLELFFSYKTFPDHYGPCRLWEIEKSEWKYYYGSNYQTYQMSKLLATVQPWEYVIIFHDKAVCDILCKGIGVNLPKMYGMISPDQNYKEIIKSWFQNFAIDSLIIKPLKGAQGLGIVLAIKINDNIFIKSKSGLTPLQVFDLSEPSIAQELIKQDRRMSVFSSSAVNSLRVVTMYTKSESIIILSAAMLCGVNDSYISNWSAGGVIVGIDSETGQLKKYAYDKKGNKYDKHPTSKEKFQDFIIPQWKSVIEVAKKIQKAMPCYRILGMDIALQENGEPIVIEINDNPDLLMMEQTNGPMFRIEQNLKAFGEYNLFFNKHQKELYRNLIIEKLENN